MCVSLLKELYKKPDIELLQKCETIRIYKIKFLSNLQTPFYLGIWFGNLETKNYLICALSTESIETMSDMSRLVAQIGDKV